MPLPTMRADMIVGTPEWARSTIDYAKSLWESREITEARWQKIVTELETGRAWEPLGKPSLDALLKAEIGHTAAESHQVLKQPRTPGPGRGHKKTDGNATSFGDGRGRDYILARLQRDGHSDLIAQVYAGELSAHAAAQQVGYRRTRTPLDQLRHWWQKASALEREVFTEFMRSPTEKGV